MYFELLFAEKEIFLTDSNKPNNKVNILRKNSF